MSRKKLIGRLLLLACVVGAVACWWTWALVGFSRPVGTAWAMTCVACGLVGAFVLMMDPPHPPYVTRADLRDWDKVLGDA